VASFVVSIRSRRSTVALICLFVFSCLFTRVAPAQTAQFSFALAHPPGGGGATPWGLAVDGQGNVYVADNADYVYSTDAPYAVAVDAQGNVYYTLSFDNEVVKYPAGGGQTTLPLTGLGNPEGLAVDSHGDVFVADYLNNRIVEAIPSGNTYIQTLVPVTRTLSLPEAVAVDGSGNLYISDTYNYRVLKETKSGSGWSESIVANLDYTKGLPISIAADAAGDVFILQFEGYSDTPDALVLKETLSGGVYTQSMLPAYGQDPYAIATDPQGNLYMNSPDGNYPNIGLLEVFAGPTTNYLPANVTAGSRTVSLVFSFNSPSTVGSPVVVSQGNAALDFADAGGGTCGTKKSSYVYNAGDSCFINVVFKPQLPGSRSGAAILQDASGNPLAAAYVAGTGIAPQISFPPGVQVPVSTGLLNPSGVAVDASGNVFIAESSSGNVYKETVSGSGSRSFSKTTIASGLSQPTGLALDGAGNVYVIAAGALYKETPAHGAYVQTQISTDLVNLTGVAVDRSANLYLTSAVAGDVHKETWQPNGAYVESTIGYGISSPTGVGVDGNGDILLLNAKDGNLYIETPQANGSYLQTSFALGISQPASLAVDGSGNVFVVDSSHGEIQKLTRQTNGSYTEAIASSGLTEPSALAVGGRGNLYCAEGNDQVAMIDVSDAPALGFATTKPGVTSPDSPKYQTVANIGNAVLDFPPPVSGTNANITAPFVLNGDTTCPAIGVSSDGTSLNAGSSCVYGISFTPPARGSFSGSLTLTDNNLYAVTQGTVQQIGLSGVSAASDSTRTSVRFSPNPVQDGLGITMIVTVADTSNAGTIPQGSVTVTDTVGGETVTLNGGAAMTLSNGEVMLTTVANTPGTHTIAAQYGGVNGSFVSSTGQVSLTVQP
jgi:sugar lactone lactonase YvrE